MMDELLLLVDIAILLVVLYETFLVKQEVKVWRRLEDRMDRPSLEPIPDEFIDMMKGMRREAP